MKTHIDHLKHGLYPEALEYLTDTTSSDSRHIRLETLEKFKIGLGQEKFLDEETQTWQSFDVIYFPMFAPVLGKKQKDQTNKSRDALLKFSDKAMQIKLNKAWEEVEDGDEGSLTMKLVKCKIRAAGKENKRYQRTMPIGVEEQALFGLPTVKEDDKFLVITEGEYDAMAVH